MANFKKKLNAVFEHAESADGTERATPNARYVPKSLGSGPGWQVYDMQEQRVLSNKEIKETPLETLRDSRIQKPS